MVGLCLDIVEAVCLLTHDKNVPYFAHIETLIASELPRK